MLSPSRCVTAIGFELMTPPQRSSKRRGDLLLAMLLLTVTLAARLAPPPPSLDEVTRAAAHQIDVTCATAAEWRSLPGLGAARAEALAEAARRGELRAPEDIMKVPGIGPATWERLRPHLGPDGEATR